MMKLGDFIWPNDPESLRISYDREVKTKLTEEGLWEVENLGRYGRTFDGEGVFYGEDAYKNLSALAMILYSGGTHELLHPKWDKADVIMTHLEVTEECQNNFLRYRFKLVEILRYATE